MDAAGTMAAATMAMMSQHPTPKRTVIAAGPRYLMRNQATWTIRGVPTSGRPPDRFQIPEGWVRAVMQQESGGKLYGADGSLITSSAGAMGLMQVMPQTFDVLQQRYRLGSDPYEPRTNILAGAAYIREMYDRYGAPNFLAAYNAGPDRLELLSKRRQSLAR